MNNSSKTDWDRLNAMTDDEIDYSDIPPLGEGFFEKAELVIPASEARSFVKLDADVLAYFQAQSPQYATLINSLLRAHMTAR
jgi:uncharacterized protein (DUF4415 family)